MGGAWDSFPEGDRPWVEALVARGIGVVPVYPGSDLPGSLNGITTLRSAGWPLTGDVAAFLDRTGLPVLNSTGVLRWGMSRDQVAELAGSSVEEVIAIGGTDSRTLAQIKQDRNWSRATVASKQGRFWTESGDVYARDLAGAAFEGFSGFTPEQAFERLKLSGEVVVQSYVPHSRLGETAAIYLGVGVPYFNHAVRSFEGQVSPAELTKAGRAAANGIVYGLSELFPFEVGYVAVRLIDRADLDPMVVGVDVDGKDLHLGQGSQAEEEVAGMFSDWFDWNAL